MTVEVDMTECFFLSRCQLQVFLRLELCLQCPSVHERVEDLEQVVDEASILLSATGTCCIQIVSAALKRPCGNFLKSSGDRFAAHGVFN